jgi:hypothetical protein
MILERERNQSSKTKWGEREGGDIRELVMEVGL